jgi:hypothetical protein
MEDLTQRRATLLVSRAEARRRLQQRVDQGKDLFPTPIRSSDDFNRAAELERKWRLYNIDMLLSLYESDKYVTEYRSSIVPISQVADRHYDPSLATYTSRLTISRNGQIATLESFIERLELAVEPSAHPAERATLTSPDVSAEDEALPVAVLNEIRATLVDIKAELPKLAVSNALKAEIGSDISQIEVEAERPTPRRRVVKIFLESLRDNLAKAAGAGGAAALVAAIGGLLTKYFGLW